MMLHFLGLRMEGIRLSLLARPRTPRSTCIWSASFTFLTSEIVTHAPYRFQWFSGLRARWVFGPSNVIGHVPAPTALLIQVG
jgi:hypothetical protein